MQVGDKLAQFLPRDKMAGAELSELAECYVSSYPNAGLKKAVGGYGERQEENGGLLPPFSLPPSTPKSTKSNQQNSPNRASTPSPPASTTAKTPPIQHSPTAAT